MNTVHHPNTEQEKIEQLRKWCAEHRLAGARTMADTWTDQDFRILLGVWGNSFQRSQEHLRRMAWSYLHGLAGAESYQQRARA